MCRLEEWLYKRRKGTAEEGAWIELITQNYPRVLGPCTCNIMPQENGQFRLWKAAWFRSADVRDEPSCSTSGTLLNVSQNTTGMSLTHMKELQKSETSKKRTRIQCLFRKTANCFLPFNSRFLISESGNTKNCNTLLALYHIPTAWYFPSLVVSAFLLLYWTLLIAPILAFWSPAGELWSSAMSLKVITHSMKRSSIFVPEEITANGGRGRENLPQYPTKANQKPQSETFSFSHNFKKHQTWNEAALRRRDKKLQPEANRSFSWPLLKHRKNDTHMQSRACWNQSFQALSALDSAHPDVFAKVNNAALFYKTMKNK